jgi:hypothetical protein
VFSLDEVERALPPQLKGKMTPELVTNLNAVVQDPDFAATVRDNLVSYTGVLREGKFKLEDYMSAVVYVSHKLMGLSDKEAWMRTFPDRYQALVARGVPSNGIAAHVTAYNKNKLVNLIYEQTLIPSWVLNQDIYQKAINVQYELMTTANSEKVRCEAANSILNHLKKPESQKVELNIGMKPNDDMAEMLNQMREFAKNQQKLIEMGVPTQQIAHERIITSIDNEEVQP